MANADDKNRVAAALDYLRSHNQYFQFDSKERVVKAAVADRTDVDEIAAHLGNLRDLEKLTFYSTDVTDRGLCHLAGLVVLKKLYIEGSGFTSAGLAHLGAMSQLEDLSLGNARDLDRAAFECIARVPSLRQLSLRGGRFCDADLEPLAGLVNLEKLSLSDNNNINGTFCRYLTELPLRKLSPGEYVTDEGVTYVAKLAGLETLFLKGPFSDAGLRQIRSLKHLWTLYITSERVTLEGLAVAADLPKLTNLGLKFTVTDMSIPILARCKSLTSLTLFRSHLTDAGLKQLGLALPDCEIDDPYANKRRADHSDPAE